MLHLHKVKEKPETFSYIW